MQNTFEQIHYSLIASQAELAMPDGRSEGFRNGYETFLSLFYIACLKQENQKLIDLSQVLQLVFKEVQDELTYQLESDIKEYWLGYFNAQEVTEKLFYLAHTPDIQAA